MPEKRSDRDLELDRREPSGGPAAPPLSEASAVPPSSPTSAASSQLGHSSASPDGSPLAGGSVSDVVLADLATLGAPSFRAPVPPSGGSSPPTARGPSPPGAALSSAGSDAPTAPAPPPVRRASSLARPMAMLPGARIDDFEIVRLLGRGAFGMVYLARQLSLDRQVALKVSANRGSEGRTMARLEHQHIVQVFSETVDPDFNQRLLCMQLVPGVGLEKIVGALHPASGFAGLGAAGMPANALGGDGERPRWTGRDLLAVIDGAASLPAALDPSALHDREALAQMDEIEATAWIGARLAEALDYAHRHGVLHRDIKPANILVNPYGRPLLADFNISSQPLGSHGDGEEMFGGTFVYMAPEHLDAFNPADPAGPEAVTARSDVYSLGLVLSQLLSGRLPVPLPPRHDDIVDTLRDIADQRRGEQPECEAGQPGARRTLSQTICRCVAPEPDARFASGAELAEQLDGCRQLRQAQRELPRLRAVFEPVLEHPFLWLVALVVLPQLAASAFNIWYNSAKIVYRLTVAQQQLFLQMVIGYNAVVYPLALVLFVRAVMPVLRGWQSIGGRASPDAGAVAAARRQALRLPLWTAALTALGWFPGGVLFPLVMQLTAPPRPPGVAAHFVVSFLLSGLIALAYSLCGVQFVVLRALYPRMWVDVRGFGEVTRRELASMTARLGWIQLLAGSIPLLAAVLLLNLGGETASRTFLGIVTGLILLGGLGYHLTTAVTRGLSQVVVALTNTKA